MPFVSGRFVRLFNWVRDQASGINITASRMDADMDDIATGLSAGICKDGQSTITANISMGGRLLQDVAAAAADGDVISREIADSRFASGLVPGGRLTLVAATPVMTSNVTTATLRYTPFVHDQIRHYNGSAFQATTFSELSITPTVAANTNYDVFSYLSGGSPALALAAWADDSTRSINLTRTQSVWLNASSVTAGPATLRGTYLGTVRTNASGTFSWLMDNSAEGGYAALLGVWNAYNRVTVIAGSTDTAAQWTFDDGGWDALGETANKNRVTLVVGLAEEPITARVAAGVYAHINVDVLVGVGVARPTDSAGTVNTPDGVVGRGSSSALEFSGISQSAYYCGIPGIGAHLIQALEYGDVGSLIFGLEDTPFGDYSLAAIAVELRA